MGIFGKQIGNPTASGVGLPVGTRVYCALLTQSGTDAPVTTVLENTLGGEVVWSYENPGRYVATLAGAFTENKTFIITAPCANAADVILLGFAGSAWVDVDSIKIRTVAIADLSSAANDVLFATAIEILVYP